MLGLLFRHYCAVGSGYSTEISRAVAVLYGWACRTRTRKCRNGVRKASWTVDEGPPIEPAWVDNACWPPILQTSSTLGKEPLKSVKSHTVTVEIETPRRAPLGESVVVTGLELTGFITGAAKVGAFEVGVFDVTPLIPPD